MQSLVEIGPVVLEKMNFFNFVSVFYLFHYNFLLEKERPFILINLYPFTLKWVVPTLVEIVPVVIE